MGAGGMGGGMGAGALSRAVFLKHVPPGVTAEDIINETAGYGVVESVRLSAERGEALVAYVDAQAAAMLLQDRPTIHFANGAAELSWGKAKAMTPDLVGAIQQGATRNLYVGALPTGVTNENLLALCTPFGAVESARMLHSGVGYVNFCTVEAAVGARARLHGTPGREWTPLAEGEDAERAAPPAKVRPRHIDSTRPGR